MAEEITFSVRESPEGGYEAQALSAPIFTQADNVEELRAAVRDATECHFEEGERPHLIRLHLSGALEDKINLGTGTDIACKTPLHGQPGR